MDFFARQDAARRSTWVLVALFALAVIGILAALNAVAFAVSIALSRSKVPVFDADTGLWQPELFGVTSLATLAVIAGGSLYRTATLASGGPAVANMMGARSIGPSAEGEFAVGGDDPAHRILRNVVEEMSIASGFRSPGVYVMEGEDGINAFAAGRSADDAVIAVTRGCLDRLTRDELQGVVGHEFSHLLNGDARLNLRLIGANYGILVIGLLGLQLVRAVGRGGTFGGTRGRQRTRSGGDDGKSALMLMAVGLSLAAIGFIGVFFGKLIQAAVSRRREALADASSVQFTRNPIGLANALRKIGGTSAGSTVDDRHSGELAHLLFADGSRNVLGHISSLFATHPPLAARIRLLDPAWDGTMLSSEGAERPSGTSAREAVRPTARALGAAVGLGGGATADLSPDLVVRRVGTLRPEDVQYAATLIGEIPPELRAACREAYSARAVVFALLSDDDPSARELQWADLAAFDSTAADLTRRLWPLVDSARRAQGDNVRLALLDLSLPALGGLSELQAGTFGRTLRRLIEHDRHTSAFEFALYTVVTRHLSRRLAGQNGRRSGGGAVYLSVSSLRDEARAVLSEVARAAGEGAGELADRSADEAYAAGAARLGYAVGGPSGLGRRLGKMNMERLGLALDKLSRASGGVKRRVIDAVAHGVAADGGIGPREAELLRAVAAALDVPLPPLVGMVETGGAGRRNGA